MAGSFLTRVIALSLLCGGGALVYAVAIFGTGAYRLSELKAPATAGTATYVSLKRQDEFDCKGSRMRGLPFGSWSSGGRVTTVPVVSVMP